ncbi:GDSL esterase/lipase At1g71250 [Selaginella moellendorffii]|nr:GDSL esterase/lipase At1g71250 [Selaginella moellendorffii]|eukprot:XP_002994082.2 GDSL esterase/lipase At1g71250 [Selaginella moellendorffii]
MKWCAKAIHGRRLLLVVFLLVGRARAAAAGALVPAMFIFGDSLVDVGNNNYLLTLAKANVAPYGIDSPWGATGRFCNGKTVLDVVCELIGLPYVPAFLDPSTKNARILKGVNYASGAGGILDESGKNYIERISMSQQLHYFQQTLSGLVQQLGSSGCQQLLSDSLFAIVIGNNDYINNYLLPDSATRFRYSERQFQDLLLAAYAQHLTELYRLGARRMVVASLGPLGCIPSQLAQKSSDGACVDSVNQLMLGFNLGLQDMLASLHSLLPGARIVYADTYTPVAAMVATPGAYGMESVNRGCCGGGRFNGQLPCFPRPISNMCSNRSNHLFWDPFHPTDAANVILGHRLFQALKSSFGIGSGD